MFRLYLVCLLNIEMPIEGLLVGDRFANRAELILGKQHEAHMLLDPPNDRLALDINNFMLAGRTAQDTETLHMICSMLRYRMPLVLSLTQSRQTKTEEKSGDA
jgi:hypothetical protein